MPLSEVFCADCLPAMREYPDGYFDLAVVDPPYGLPPDSSNGRGKLRDRAFNRGRITSWDERPSKEYFSELFRISKAQIIWGGNYFELPPCRGFIVWDKLQPWENFSRCEYAWTSFNCPSKLFQFDNRTGDKIHPTQKPVALYRWIYQHYAKPGDKILDTHMGSQSSRIAAYDAGLDYTGYEIDEEYFQLGCERFDRHTAQMSLFVE